jgi:hypothetical protein
MQIKLALLACCALAACHSTQPVPSETAIIGIYLYHSDDPENKATDHELDRLTLQADGNYELIEGGPTRRKSKKTGVWHLSRGERPQLLLNHSGYPIEISGNEVRLLIDSDLGIWYSKVE